MTAKRKLPKCRFCGSREHKEKCPLCGAILHQGGFDKKHADDSLCCTRKGCWYFVVNVFCHLAICAKLQREGGKVVRRGFMCDMPGMCFDRQKMCWAHKGRNCRRVEIRLAEGGKQ